MVLLRVSTRFESVARVRVVGVDCFLNDLSLILRFRVFHIFRILEYSVYSAIPLNSVTPEVLMSKKILNAGLISVLRIESVSYVL